MSTSKFAFERTTIPKVRTGSLTYYKKVACAFIPNADLLGGYPCFVLSIAMVGLITFFVQAPLT